MELTNRLRAISIPGRRLSLRHGLRVRAVEVILPVVIDGVGDDAFLVAFPTDHVELVADDLGSDWIVENALFGECEA